MSGVTLFGLLSGGSGALQLNQQGTAVHGNNVTNANTLGYSRRDLLINEGRGAFPGAQVTGLVRSVDVVLSRRLSVQEGLAQGTSLTTSGLKEIEQAIQAGQSGLSQRVSDLAASLSQLGAAPADESRRADVIEKGRAVAAEFHRVGQVLGQLQGQNLDRARAELPQISSLSQKVADLNRQTLTMDAGSDGALRSQDAADQAARTLSGLVGGDVLRNADGTLDVLLNGRSVVHGVVAAAVDVSTAGQVTVAGQAVQGTVGGALGAYLVAASAARDNLAQFDQLALDFTAAVNTQHAFGMGRDGGAGRPFFQPVAVAAGAAVSLKIDPGLTTTTLAVGLTAAPGDNRNAVALGNLLGQPVLEGGRSSFRGVYTRIMTQLGAKIQQSDADTQTAQALQADLDASRAAQSGVSTDEETTQLMAYQRGFEASAKFVQTVDQMLQTLIAMKT